MQRPRREKHEPGGDDLRADVAGVAVGRDDPAWVRLAGRLGLDPAADVQSLPKACYVSFADVVRLWQAAPASRGVSMSL